jgi:aspartyl-tRNA(Asn)/glutamyl-tRNA(Gln) amidotransferase subunit B
MTELPYEIVIGLEVHVQLATRTKLFCRCSTAFGSPPNTQTCPVCIGLPGALPVMNRRAFQLALKAAVALNCRIPEFTKWDRKQYYYPDLPKGYQISQFDQPMSEHGWLEISDPKDRFPTKRVGIVRAHLEEDAGKSMHDELAGRADSRIDLNRTGTPLLEIVSAPDMRSALEARAYLTELKLLLTYIGVSDCNMQEGSLRVDANINLHLPDTRQPAKKVATPIVEVKNMNSFRAVERAMEFEAQRQYEVWLETRQQLGQVPKQTRGWDEQAQVTKGQRSKEESSDYRYFPDPDLAPVMTTATEVEEVRAGLGELPAQLRQRLHGDYGLPAYDAEVIVSQGRAVVDYFETVAKVSGDFKRASNWVQQFVFATLNDQQCTIEQFTLPAHSLGMMVRAIAEGKLDGNRAKDVYQRLLETGESLDAALKSLGIEAVDDHELREICRQLLAQNPDVVADVKAGKEKAIGALIGQAKRKNPNAHPNQVREICLALIASM